MIKRQVNPPDTSSFSTEKASPPQGLPAADSAAQAPQEGTAACAPSANSRAVTASPERAAGPRVRPPRRSLPGSAPGCRERLPPVPGSPSGRRCRGGRKSPGTTNRGMPGTVPCSSQEMSFVQPHRKPQRGVRRAARQSASEPAPPQLPPPQHKGRRAAAQGSGRALAALAPGRPPPRR